MKNIIKTLMAVFIFVILNTTTYAIDLITTPLKYELEVNPGESITKTAKIINREETDLYISI
ncbi:MAG: hypothetical protein LBQ24_05110 [Candidatus Peribacteria bacterium]|jgi:hypothetical protein|nr:hypothetical protein [Candidatus Peribacteria bacterium]